MESTKNVVSFVSNEEDEIQKPTLNLVDRRDPNETSMVSQDRVHQIHDVEDPEKLLNSIVTSRQIVRTTANAKLVQIGQQMDFLQARKVVLKCRRDEKLHEEVACNFQKKPLTTYHLYERPNGGQQYFSMLSPAEWGKSLKSTYLGSYRLEADGSFTRMDQTDEFDDDRSRQFRALAEKMAGTEPWDLILDNGAYNAKLGYSTDEEPRVVHNQIFKGRSERHRNFVADELNECHDKSKLFYMSPFERGYLVNWDYEFEIWDRLFGSECLNVDFKHTRLLLTDPSMLVSAIQRRTEEIVFETYQFNALNLTCAPTLIGLFEYQMNGNENTIVVDSGYSFTHVIPYHLGKAIGNGIRRIDIGGKALTNQLKEWISYKQLDVKDETFIVNHCKEKLCFITRDIKRDMEMAFSLRSNNKIRREYVMPDYSNLMEGYVCQELGQASETPKISLCAERFLTPELLFHPNDIGIEQCGIVEAIENSIKSVCKKHPDFGNELKNNVVCTGGNSLIDGFAERIRQDLRPLIDESENFNVVRAENPITYAWTCAQQLLQTNNKILENGYLTHKMYNEIGADGIYAYQLQRLEMTSGAIVERNQDATVYVGGLDEKVSESVLWELFVQAGPVVSVNMPKDRITGTHQGFGFVEFMGEEDADYAIKIMNMIKLFGKPIKVNKASANEKNIDVGANLFVGNLDLEVDEKLLFDTFSAFGMILQVPKIMRDPESGNSKGFAFVNFASFEASDMALEAMNGQYLCNRAITCSYAFKKDAKGERHGTAAERLLASQNPLFQQDRPHQIFSDMPGTPRHAAQTAQQVAAAVGLPVMGQMPPPQGFPMHSMMGAMPPGQFIPPPNAAMMMMHSNYQAYPQMGMPPMIPPPPPTASSVPPPPPPIPNIPPPPPPM
ncbi:hypothetical protein M3Y98_00105500 [Aphelenchoides besseyi]|nr:hypothetical protein M3Y98_00105500 [Aphelenchoides besseyi]